MKTLLSMVVFVLEQIKVQQSTSEFKEVINNYAQFLSKTLEIWMFVPCKFVNGKWVVLNEPESRGASPHYVLGATDEEAELYNEWLESKERVLFEGFEFYKDFGNVIAIRHSMGILSFNRSGPKSVFKQRTFENMEELVKYNLELTPTAIKEIGV